LFWPTYQNDAKTVLYATHAQGSTDFMAGSKFLENLIAGSSKKIQDVRKHIELAAPFPVSVMAVGPTGSGKELIAKGIHKLSGRSGKFIAVNSCCNSRRASGSGIIWI
jgi:DNA-binding NtrC family response regulator